MMNENIVSYKTTSNEVGTSLFQLQRQYSYYRYYRQSVIIDTTYIIGSITIVQKCNTIDTTNGINCIAATLVFNKVKLRALIFH